MKFYVDEKGNLIEKPETLRDHLEIKAPELAERVDKIIAWKAIFNAYRFFLYSFPSDQESEKSRTNWEKYIDGVNSQEGLTETLDVIEGLRSDGADMLEDRIIVVRSDRPFYDTVLQDPEKRKGRAEGWIGVVESHGISDVADAPFYSLDGKIHQRFSLKKARKLTEDELKEWAAANIAYAVHHHNTEGVEACIKRLQKHSLGRKKVIIYDKYSNIDYLVLEHVPKDIEKAVAHIPYEDAQHIDLLPYYGDRKIPGSHLCVLENFRSSPSCQFEFIGEDKRNIGEIYKSIRRALETKIDEEVKAKYKLEKVHIYLGKQVRNFITPEQRATAKKAPYYCRNKWLKKFIDEQGLEITDHTLVGVGAYGIPAKGSNIRATNELILTLEKLLIPQGYNKVKMNISYGYNYECSGRMRANTNYDIEPDTDLFAGELIIHDC